MSHAAYPVVVVHPAVGVSHPARLVVGVNGSAESRAALAPAVDEAGRMDAEVAVVTYAIADYWTELTSVIVAADEQIRGEHQRLTHHLVEEVPAERHVAGRPQDPRVRTVVFEGSAGEVLVDRGRRAALLLVGRRGRGAWRGRLPGSVALHCAMHALWPVMVVHPHRHGAKAAPASAEQAMAGC